MRLEPGQRQTPDVGIGGCHKDSAPTASPIRILSHEPPPPTRADLAAPIVDLISELRSDIPLPIIATLVVEALDKAADTALDKAWARQREAAYPAALRLVHNRHAGHTYAERRAREVADSAPRPGDYRGRVS
jgi:hypothetical protein